MTVLLPLVGSGPQGGSRHSSAETYAPMLDDVAPDEFDADFEALPGEDMALHATKNAEFTVFMEQAVGPLHRMAYLLCGDQHRAEELTQQTFERTYRSWARARDGDPLAYARRILANLRIDTWRRTRREVLSGPETLQGHAEELLTGPGPGRGSGARAAPGAVDDRDLVVRALLQLPLKQRRVVVMRHLLDLSEVEVSTELDIPVGTVKSTASRALARLRTILDDSSLKGRTS